MGKRLTRIYTRTGDQGETGLADGQRVAKDSLRIEAIGSVDELNSSLGLLRADNPLVELDPLLASIQNDLFDLGGELSIPGAERIGSDHVNALEHALDQQNESLPPLTEFILPAGGRATADCHLARSICRRVERALVALQRAESVNAASLRYLNRLSDLLFVLARVLVRSEQGQEVTWQPGQRLNP